MEIEREGSISLESLIPGWVGPANVVWPTSDVMPANMPQAPSAPQGAVVETLFIPDDGTGVSRPVPAIESPPQHAPISAPQATQMPSDNAIWLSTDGEAIGMLAGEPFPMSPELAASASECLLGGYAQWQAAKMADFAAKFGMRQANSKEPAVSEAQPTRGMVRAMPGEGPQEDSPTASEGGGESSL